MKAVVCLALFSLFALSSAFPYGPKGWGWGWPYYWGDYYHHYPGYYPGFYGWYHYGHYPKWVSGKSWTYHGKYSDACPVDGFYYNDADSFVICSNGNAFRMECAPGSKNSGLGHFKSGHAYYHHDFCDVNLVAQNKY